MYHAIETKYLGPTNTLDPRVVARSRSGRRYCSWDHALNAEDNHAAAAKAHAEKFGWSGAWRGGYLRDGVYVFTRSAPGDSPDFTIAERSK